jgi:stage II sporulation protein D
MKFGVGTLIGIILFLSNLAFSQSIRIRTHRNESKIHISGQNVQVFADKKLISASESLIGNHKISLKRMKQKGQWVWQLTGSFVKEHFIEARSVLIKGDFLEVNKGVAVPDQVKLLSKSNLIDLIVELPLEDYLLGVLPREMPLNWPLESLKAQAVASRSYVLSLLNERKGWHFDVDSTVNDQVFSWVRDLKKSIPKFNQLLNAIQETRGQILLFNKNQIYRAFFHAESAGRTENAEFVWGPSYSQPSQSVTT